MLPKAPRILYFLKGSMPTAEQQIDAMRYGSGVVFRNGSCVPVEGSPEACDGVAGDVPTLYSAMRSGEDAMREYLAKTNLLSQPANPVETPAPVVPVTPVAPPAPVVIPAAPAAPLAPVEGGAWSTGAQEHETITE